LTLKLLLPLAFLLGAVAPAAAESEQMLVVKITPRVIESDQTVSWEQPLTQVTKAGVPVVVKIDAGTLAIRVTVTPFVRGPDFLLVVQGEVRQRDEKGSRGSSSLQSLLVPPGESIVFFPLGRQIADSDRQMVVMMKVEYQGE